MTMPQYLVIRWFLMAVAIVSILGTEVQAAQQPEAPNETGIDPGRLEQLIDTIENPEARARFVDQLRTLMDAGAATIPDQSKSVDELGVGLVELVSERVSAVGLGLVEASSVIVDLPDLTGWLHDQAVNPEARQYWFEGIGRIALLLVLSWLASRLVRRSLVARLRRIEQESPGSLVARMPLIASRATLRLLPIAAFGIVGYVILPLLQARPATRVIAESLVDATVVSGSLMVAVRTVLAPSAPQLRLLTMSDELAKYLHRWLKRFVYFIAYTYVIFQNELLLQIPSSIYEGIERLLGFVVVIMTITVIVQNRKPVAEWLRGHDDAEDRKQQRSLAVTRRLLADVWHAFAIVYVIGTYLIWALNIPGGFALLLRGAVLTTLLMAMARPLAYGIERLLGRGLAFKADRAHHYRVLERRINRYCRLLQRIAVGSVYFLIVLVLLQVWGVDPIGRITAFFSGDVLGRLAQLGTLLAVTFLIWEAVSALVENYLNGIDDTGTRIERSGRARTLLPLLRAFLLAVLLITVFLTALSTLGVDVTPLLAAAGVVGIAVGFGSQKLVQDIINGLFILLQDTISVGDVVEVPGHAGTVERISVRTIELRDLAGNMHTIPFSEVSTIINKAKEFGYADFEIGVAYRENVDEVMEVIRQLGADLEADPEFGQYILEPIEVLGVDAFADSAVIIKARIKTKALKQWYVKREFNRLMKHRFDELGIEIPFPHQTVYFGEDKAGVAPPMRLKMDRSEVRAQAERRPRSLRVVEQSGPEAASGEDD